jgi:autophagy-related protein 9
MLRGIFCCITAWPLLLLIAAGAILQFVADTTTRVEGVGDVCSLAVFDFGRHGNSKYGAPAHAPAKRLRSKQVGKTLFYHSLTASPFSGTGLLRMS